MTISLQLAAPEKAQGIVQRNTVAAGTTDSVYRIPGGTTVGIEPGDGGTMTAQVRVTPDSPLVDLDLDNASYSAPAVLVIDGPVWELQFGAAGADGAGSVSY